MFRKKQDSGSNDTLAMVGLFAVFFGFLSSVIVGGAVGGAIAGGAAYVVHQWLPPNDDGKRLPTVISLLLIPVGIGLFLLPFLA